MATAMMEHAPAREPPQRSAPRSTTAPPAQTTESLLSSATPGVRLSAAPVAGDRPALAPQASAYVQSPGPGEPLSTVVRAPIERSLSADLSSVRVHNDSGAQTVAASLPARAFAYGNHIFLGSGAQAGDLHLMAHESTHVVQQQSHPRVAGYSTSGGDALEAEARSSADAAQAGRAATVRGRTGPQVQGDFGEWAESKAWSVLEEFAPELVPILRKGVFQWLKEQISDAVKSLFDRLMAPVRIVTGLSQSLVAHFASLIAWMRDAAARIARGDCSALSEAAEKIEKVVEGLAAPVIEKIKQVAGKIGDFFTGLWNKFGAPIWDFLKEVGGTIWEKIQSFASAIWKKTEKLRGWISTAWTWFKNKLGVGEGPEGQDGLLQWVQRKAGDAWDALKAGIEPIKKPLMVVGGIAVMLSPAGPLIALGAGVVGLMYGIRWIRQNLRDREAIIRQRGYVQGVIIPQILSTAQSVKGAVQHAANFIAGKLNEILSNLRSVGGGGVLAFLTEGVQWVATQIQGLVDWATGHLIQLVEFIAAALDRLPAVLRPIMDVLRQVGDVIIDVLKLPMLLATRVWNIVPACIRDPIVDFVVPIILRQIPLFKELGKDNDAWQKTRADVMHIIRQVFVNRDLIGAVKSVFQLMLRAFNVPIDLAVEVLKKAATAWDVVLAKPMEFIKTAVRALGHGFKLFGKNILKHLEFGVEGWLFGELADRGIHPPASWTDPMELLKFVLEVLGLSMNHVFDLLKKRFDKAKVEKLQVWYGRLKSAWDWIKQTMDTSKSPQEITKGLIAQAKEFAKSVLTGIAEWIAKKVAAEIAVLAAAAAASAGISEAIDLVRRIYIAINSAVRWMRKVWDPLESTCRHASLSIL